MTKDGSKHIIFLMNRWMSSAGGIQTVNRNLASAIAKQNPQINCVCLVTQATSEEKEDARFNKVQIIEGDSPDDWSSVLLSDDLASINPSEVIAVIGHSKFSGNIATILRNNKFPEAVLVQFVHTIPLDTEGLKEYRQDSYVKDREERMAEELRLAQGADVVVSIGPRIARYIGDQLKAKGWTGKLLTINCGVSRLDINKQMPSHPTVLFIGRTDSISVKGLDILALSAAYLKKMWTEDSATRNRPYPRFVIRGGGEFPEKLESSLKAISEEVAPSIELFVKPYTTNQDELQMDYLGASALIMPSRQEGFGLVVCEAISLGTPVVLSAESGIAEVIRQVASEKFLDLGKMIVSMNGTVNEIAEEFAAALRNIFENEEKSLEHVHQLREFLISKSSWDEAAHDLLDNLGNYKMLDEESKKSSTMEVLDESVENSQSEEPNKIQSILSQAQNILMQKEGVISVGIKQAIIVIVEEGASPSLPTQFEGVDVIVRYVDKITFSSAFVVTPGDTIVFEDKKTSLTGPIVIDSNNNNFIVTAAHPFRSISKQAKLKITRQGQEKGEVKISEISDKEDIALLEGNFDVIRTEQTEATVPLLGAKVNIALPRYTLSGKITGLDVDVKTSISVKGLFIVELDSSDLRAGDSGAVIYDYESNIPIGVLVAFASETESQRILAFGKPIAAFLAERNLKVLTVSNTSDTRITRKRITIAILVDDHNTLAKVLTNFSEVHQENLGNRVYSKGTFKGHSNIDVFVIPFLYAGNLGAAVAANNLLRDLNPDILLVIGLAGGISQEVKLGDVVIAASIIHYEPARITDSGLSPRFKVIYNISNFFLNIIRQFVTHFAQQSTASENSQVNSHIKIGSIASGEKIFLSHNEFSKMFMNWTKVLAIDMEGAGVAEAINNDPTNIPLIVIRGISDLIDISKNDQVRESAIDSAIEISMKFIEFYLDYNLKLLDQ